MEKHFVFYLDRNNMNNSALKPVKESMPFLNISCWNKEKNLQVFFLFSFLKTSVQRTLLVLGKFYLAIRFAICCNITNDEQFNSILLDYIIKIFAKMSSNYYSLKWPILQVFSNLLIIHQVSINKETVMTVAVFENLILIRI